MNKKQIAATIEQSSQDTIGQLPPEVWQYITQLVKLHPHHIVVVTGPDGYFKFASPSVESILGWTPLEFTSRLVRDSVEPSDWERTNQEYQAQVRQGKTTFSFENRYRHKDGGSRWLEWHSQPYLQTGLLIAIAQDITEKKLLEEKVIKAFPQVGRSNTIQNSLRILISYKNTIDASTIFARTDHRGKIEYVNDKLCEISGYSHKELEGQDHRIINSGYHPPEFFAEMWRTIKSGEIWRGMVCNQKKGYLFSVENLSGNTSMGQLIRQLQQDLGFYPGKHQDPFVQVQEFIKSHAFVNRVQSFTTSPQIHKLLQEEKINPVDRFNQRLEVLIALYPNLLKASPRSRQGYYWVDTTIVPALGADGKPVGFSVIRADHTEYKKMEKHLLAAHADEARANLVDVIAHEVNNYLASASGNLELGLLSLEQQIPETVMRNFKQAQRAIVRSGQVMSDILKAHRNIKTEKNNLNLSEILLNCAHNMKSLLIKHSVEMLINNRPWAEFVEIASFPPVYGDLRQLEQVLTNIIKNAVESMLENSNKHRRIEIQIKTSGEGVSVDIGNNGPAIPEDKKESIFRPFESSKKSKGGNGLGLYVVKKIIEGHGGSIHVNPNPVHFIITFPVSKHPQPVSSSSGPAPMHIPTTDYFRKAPNISPALLAQAKAQKLKIVFVDDEKGLHGVFKGFLRGDDFKSFTNLRDTRQSLSSEVPDLIILDHLIKGDDGLELAHELKALHYPAAIVMSSGNPLEEINGSQTLIQHLKSIGLEGYISKPFSSNQILSDLTLIFRLRKLLPRQILLVDDEIQNLEIWQAAMNGYQTEICLSAEEALEKVRHKQYALVLSDKKMESGSGITLLQKIRQISPLTALGLITGELEEQILPLRQSGEFDEVLSKGSLKISAYANLAQKYLGRPV